MAITLKPIVSRRIRFGIKGISPLIQHRFSEKAKRQMAEKHAGKRTKNREIRDPNAEFEEAAYRMPDGSPAISLMAFKNSIISVAHKDIGIEKTLVRKAVFVVGTHSEFDGPVTAMVADDPTMRTDPVKVGMSTDLRYRPMFEEWKVQITMDLRTDLITPEDLANLVNHAGFSVGIGDWRPEKGGEFGRFELDRDVPMEEIKNG